MMIVNKEKMHSKKEYEVPQMEVFAFEAQGALLEGSSVGDVIPCSAGDSDCE